MTIRKHGGNGKPRTYSGVSSSRIAAQCGITRCDFVPLVRVRNVILRKPVSAAGAVSGIT